MIHTGHCLCGGVRFEVRGDLGPPVACHCQYCRRAHGSPFSIVSLIRRSDLHFTAGKELLTVWDTAGGGQRVFCSRCGTRIGNYPRKYPGSVSLVLGTLDAELERGPVAHVNVESKAPWYEIADGAPQFDALPKGAEEALAKGEG